MPQPLNLDNAQIARLPIQIAAPAEELARMDDGRARLWAGLEITEAVLRWLFAVTAGVIQAQQGRIPDKLLRSIAEKIQRPTMGGWRDMTGQAANLLLKSKKDDFGHPFARMFKEHDRPIGTGKKLGTWGDVTALRNAVIHGGGLTEAAAINGWNRVAPQVGRLLGDLASAHARYDVVARLDDALVRLLGPEPTPLPDGFAGLPAVETDGTWLVRDDGRLASLRPLLTYEPITEAWEIDQFDTIGRNDLAAVPQSYYRRDKGKLYYVPIGIDDLVSFNVDTSAFDAVFRPIARDPDARIQARQFAEARERHLSKFVGRADELERIEGWLADAVRGGDKLGLIVGGPGLGKSALVARAAMEQLDRAMLAAPGSRQVVFHAFSAENVINDRRFFLINVLQQVQEWAGEKPGSIDRMSGDANAIFEAIDRDLTELFRSAPNKRLTIFVDGLDEIVHLDRSFPELLLKLTRPNVVIVAATRNESFVGTLLERSRTERIAFAEHADGLTGMREADIRALLLQGLGGRHARDVVALDRDAEGERAANPFIERVVERAAGKPLYVELLLADLNTGGARVDPNTRLPAGLEDYYGKLLARQGLSDTKAHLAIALCLLALSPEPLATRTLADLLARAPGALRSADAAEGWVLALLREGDVFVTGAETPDGAPAFALYHQELKRFILGPREAGAPHLRWAFGLARWMLADLAADETTTFGEATSGHLARHGAAHLLAHADAVRPRPLRGSIVDAVSARYLSAEGVAASHAAWFGDSEAFLRAHAKVDGGLVGLVGQEGRDRRHKVLLRLTFERPETEIEPSTFQSVYGYGQEYGDLFDGLIDAALSEDLAGVAAASDVGRLRLAGWGVIAGGVARRAGKLDRAGTRLAAAIGQLDALPSRPDVLRIRAIAEYEHGYIAYSRSEQAEALSHMWASRDAAREARDANGAHIANSVALRYEVVFALADGADAEEPIDRYRRFLQNELPELARRAATAVDSGGRLLAERWEMNSKAHLFDCAYYASDLNAAVHWHDLLIRDPWMRKLDDKATRQLILGWRNARLHALEGDIEGAITDYANFLPAVPDEGARSARGEGIAELYLEYARLLRDAGRTAEAITTLHDGLRTHDEFANGVWKPAIRRLLRDLDEGR